MEGLGRYDVRFDQQEQGACSRAHRADLIGQRRQAKGDAFTLKPIALAVVSLVQAVFLEDEASQEVETFSPCL